MIEATLFEKYSIDTNVIVSFLGDGPDEIYPIDTFAPQWSVLEAAFKDGRAVAAKRVSTELKKWDRLATVKEWRHEHRFVFRNVESDEQLAAAKAIANRYPAYGLNVNQLGDLEVMALAKARGLTVVTLESTKQHSPARPKIPNVCDEFEIACMGLKDFLREEGGPEIGVTRTAHATLTRSPRGSSQLKF
jgi:predicted nucleic acid-binding protein